MRAHESPLERKVWPTVSQVSQRLPNVVRTSMTHSAIASCATFLFLPHLDVICDLLDARQHEIYLQIVSSVAVCAC